MVRFDEIKGTESSVMADQRTQLMKKLMELTQRKGYQIIQTNGQRIYSPPATLNISKPPKGSEVFLGKLPKNIYEDELIPFLERIGPLYKFRLMLDFEEKTRGYAFATYFTSEAATRAVRELNNCEIRRNVVIGIYKSVDNCRLFIGNLPMDKSRVEVKQTLTKFVDGVVDIIMYPHHEYPALNRGFVFVEFENHRLAAMARRQFTPDNLIAWGQPLYVDWADPLPEVDPVVMAQVNVLYLRNLPLDYKPLNVFTAVCNRVGTQIVKKVHKINNYAFLHMVDRNSAEYAMAKLKDFRIGGYRVGVEWARPRRYSKRNKVHYPPENFCTSVPPNQRRLVQQRVAEMNSSSGSNKSPKSQDGSSGSQETLQKYKPTDRHASIRDDDDTLSGITALSSNSASNDLAYWNQNVSGASYNAYHSYFGGPSFY